MDTSGLLGLEGSVLPSGRALV